MARSHPTTRIVVDLEKACAYELTPGPAGKLVLSLHASADAKAVVPATRGGEQYRVSGEGGSCAGSQSIGFAQ